MGEQETAWDKSKGCTVERLDGRFRLVSQNGSYQGTASLYYRNGVLVKDPLGMPIGYRFRGEFEEGHVYFPQDELKSLVLEEEDSAEEI